MLILVSNGWKPRLFLFQSLEKFTLFFPESGNIPPMELLGGFFEERKVAGEFVGKLVEAAAFERVFFAVE